MMSVFNAVPHEGSKVIGIQCWLSALLQWFNVLKIKNLNKACPVADILYYVYIYIYKFTKQSGIHCTTTNS